MSGIGKIISVLLVLGITLGARAQDLADSEIMIDQVQEVFIPASVDFTASDIFLRQSGSDNTAKLIQDGSHVKLYVIQQGMCGQGNNVTVTQDGSNLYAGIAQVGSLNSVYLGMEGRDMMVGIGQLGYENNVKLDLKGDHKYFGIMQIGRHHNIEFESLTSGTEIGFGLNGTMGVVPIRITQKGMGANLIIRGN
jgi:hypothetical protein